MPGENELAVMLRGIIKEEMQSVRDELRQEVRSVVQEGLTPIRQDLQDLRAGQQALGQGQGELNKAQAGIEKNQRKMQKDIKEMNLNISGLWDNIKRLDNRLTKQEFKVLRHTAVTMLINQGLPAKSISGRLGHANISTTMDTYGHYLKSADKEAANQLEQVYQRMTDNGKKDTIKRTG